MSRPQSKATTRALKLIEGGMSYRAAARRCGIDVSTITKARQRAKAAAQR